MNLLEVLTLMSILCLALFYTWLYIGRIFIYCLALISLTACCAYLELNYAKKENEETPEQTLLEERKQTREPAGTRQ